MTAPQRPSPTHITEKRHAMKRFAFFALALALSIGPQSAFAQSPLIDGQITKVDQSAGKITIRHGPAKKLGMDERMTMIYRVQDPAMLAAVKAGDKIKFDADQVNGQYTVTKIEKAK
jgi:Cu(I)/Ag(I) efflux system periplasmic protein CusF